jgi:hypothetical protein
MFFKLHLDRRRPQLLFSAIFRGSDSDYECKTGCAPVVLLQMQINSGMNRAVPLKRHYDAYAFELHPDSD